MIAWAALALTLAPGPAAGEVTLAWEGEASPFAIRRAASAALVDAPGAHLANTLDTSFVDAAAPPIVFYRVVETTCGDGSVDFGEECDDGAHAGGDGCTARCMREAGSGCAAAGPWFPPAPGSLWSDAALFWRLDESGEAPRSDAVVGHQVFSDPSADGTVPVPGKAGGIGQHLDGPNRFHFWCPTAPVLNHFGGSFTWVGWARMDSRYDDQAIVGKWSMPEQQREYLVRYNATTGVGSSSSTLPPNQISGIPAPRVIRFGLRVMW